MRNAIFLLGLVFYGACWVAAPGRTGERLRAATLADSEINALGEELFADGTDTQRKEEIHRLLYGYFSLDMDERVRQLTGLLPLAATKDDGKGVYQAPLQRFFYLLPGLLEHRNTSFDGIFQFCLSHIDYTVDAETIPVGLSVPGDFFYPCADALVRLRVRRDKVLSAIADLDPKTRGGAGVADNAPEALKLAVYRKRLRLLTWVLYRLELEDADLVRFLLQREATGNKEGKGGNFAGALLLMKEPETLFPIPWQSQNP